MEDNKDNGSNANTPEQPANGVADVPTEGAGKVIPLGGSEASQPQAAPTMPTPQVGGGGKSKKKPLIIGLIVTLLLVAGALAYVFLFSDSDDNEDNSTNNEPQASQFEPEVFVQNDRTVLYMNETGELEEFATLAAGDSIIEVENDENVPIIRYVNKNASEALTEYGEIVNGERTTLVELPANTSPFYGYDVSPNDDYFVAEISDANGFMQEIAKFNVSDGTQETIYTPSDETAGLLSIVSWAEDDEVLVQHLSCRQCDGPRLPKLSSLNTETGELSDFYEGDSDQLNYASFVPSVENDVIYEQGGDVGKVFEVQPGLEYGADYIYKVADNSGDATKLAESGDVLKIVGEKTDGSEVYLSTTAINPDTGAYEVPALKMVSINGGDLSDIAIETKYIKQGTLIQSATNVNDGVILVVQNNSEDGNTRTYNLLHLSLGEEENTLTSLLETTTAGFDVMNIFLND